ncbi:serine/threonine-protein kinase [Nocardiopsis tropica]|uniref:non-specific serine/threonine protein kinase n=1 Tax=Nocardiopsis tropica TaxID=109330 RepID=A0ABU7KIJ4_9ACTN|nr:serine/threonine-protein kinase [Nocardiopsis umidischolae]MEE2049118.1 serine/threonine-protein kinase [Nocardiopsis umidischolae]
MSFAPVRPGDPATVGAFRVVGRIGSGGMGTVYAGTAGRGGYAAVKVIRADLAEDPALRDRFTREVRLLRRVRSRAVPAFVAAGVDGGNPWLATEFVPGRTLSDHVRSHGPLTGPPLDGLAVGTAEALRAVHAAGIVHRDLKPGNVMLSPEGPKVLDFGISRALDETVLTRTGGLFGTPGWIAPELLRGAPPSPAADVFAWGALVAHAASGRPPFGTGPADALVYRVLREEPDLSAVPARLLPLVSAALDKEPGRRPTAAQLVSSLTGTPSDLPSDEVAASVDRALDRSWREIRAVLPAAPRPRRPRALLPAGAALLLVLAVAAGAVAARVLAPGAGPDGAAGGPAQDAAGTGAEAHAGWTRSDVRTGGHNVEWWTESRTGADLVVNPAEAAPGDRPSFTASPDSFESAFSMSVDSVDATPEGVRFAFTVDLMEVELGDDVPSMLAVTAGEGPLAPTGVEADGEVGAGSAFAVTFDGAPDEGLLVLASPDYVPNVSGVPPTGFCYDASARTLSSDLASCDEGTATG